MLAPLLKNKEGNKIIRDFLGGYFYVLTIKLSLDRNKNIDR